VNDVSPEIGMYHWYDGGKTTTLSVNNTLSVIGSEYLYAEDEFENCGTSLTNLVLADYNGWGYCSHGNVYIYVNNAGGCDMDLTYASNDDKTYFETFLEVIIYEYDEEYDDGFEGSTHYFSLQFKDSSVPEHPLYSLWSSVSGRRMYSGKTIDMKLTGKLNGEVVAEFPVRITVGTFGDIHFGLTGRVIM
jgi:hypothetical protein